MGQTLQTERVVSGHRRTAEAVERNMGGRPNPADRLADELARDVRAMHWEELTSLVHDGPLGDSGYADTLLEVAAREIVRRLDEHAGVAA